MNPFSWIRRKLAGSKAQSRAAAAPNTRPRSWDRYLLQLETLENRLAPAVVGPITWTGLGDGQHWSDSNNWTGGAPATIGVGNSAALVFHANTATTMTDDLPTLQVDSMTFNAAGAPAALGYTLNGTATLDITGGGINQVGTIVTAFGAPGSASLAINSNVIGVSSVAGIAPGQLITGPGIPAGTTVTSVDAVNDKVTMSNPAFITNPAQGGLNFYSPVYETIGAGITIQENVASAISNVDPHVVMHINAAVELGPTTVTESGNLTTGSKTVTGLTSTANIVVGETVTGTGIPVGTIVTAVPPTTAAGTIKISNAATVTGTESLTFSGGPFGLVITGAGIPTSGLFVTNQADIADQGVVMNGVISGSVPGPANALLLDGEVTLGGANTYKGSTAIGDPGGAGPIASVNVTNNSGLGDPTNTTTVTGNAGVFGESTLLLDNVSITQAGISLLGIASIIGDGAVPAGVPGAGPIGTGADEVTIPNPGTLAIDAAGNPTEISTDGANTRLQINASISGGSAGGGLFVFGNVPVPVTGTGPLPGQNGVVEFMMNNNYLDRTVVDGAPFTEILQVDAPSGLTAGAGGTTSVGAGSTLLLNFNGTLQDLAGNAELLDLAGNGAVNTTIVPYNATTETGVGALQVLGSASPTINGAVLLDGGDTTIGVGSGTLTFTANAVISESFAGTNLNYAQDVSFPPGTNVGAVINVAANTYTGNTDIGTGVTLNIAKNKGLGSGAAAATATVESGASLQLSPGFGGVMTISENITLEAAAGQSTGTAPYSTANSATGQLDALTGTDTIKGVITLDSVNGVQHRINAESYAPIGPVSELILSGVIQGTGVVAGAGGGLIINGTSAPLTEAGTTAIGSTAVTGLATVAGITPGAIVSGTGIPAGTFVVFATSPTSVTLSNAATATGAHQLVFTPVRSTGTVKLSGAASNTFGGAVNVDDGTLELDKTGGAIAIPSVPLTIGDSGPDNVGALFATAGLDVVQVDASNQISTSAPVTINVDGDLFLDAAVHGNGVTIPVNETVGALTLNGGKVTGVDGTGGPGGPSTTTLTLNGDVTATSVIDPVNSSLIDAVISTDFVNLTLPPAGGTRTFTVSAANPLADGAPLFNPDLEVFAALTNGANAVNVVKAGTGTMTLFGGNTYTGTTTVSAGILVVDGFGATLGALTLPSGAPAGGVSVASGASLVLIDAFSSKPLTLNGPGFSSNVAALDVAGGGAIGEWVGPITLAGSAASTIGAQPSSEDSFSELGTTTAGSFVITGLAATSRIQIGATVTGTGIPAGATVTAVNAAAGTVTFTDPGSTPATVTGNPFLTFAFLIPESELALLGPIVGGTAGLTFQEGGTVVEEEGLEVTGTTTAGSPAVTGMLYTTGIVPGTTISGPGIPLNTTVTAVTATGVTLSNNATATGPTGLIFGVNNTYGGLTTVTTGTLFEAIRFDGTDLPLIAVPGDLKIDGYFVDALGQSVGKLWEIAATSNVTIDGVGTLNILPFIGGMTQQVLLHPLTLNVAAGAGVDLTETGSTVLGDNLVTGLASTTGITVGETVTGAAFGIGTTVAKVNSPTSVTLNFTAGVTGTGPVTFTAGASVLLNATSQLQAAGVTVNDNGKLPSNITGTAAAGAPLTEFGATTLGSPTITGLLTTNGITVGTVVTGPGIPGAGNTVVSVTANTVTLANNATATGTGVMSFAGVVEQQLILGGAAANPFIINSATPGAGVDLNIGASIGGAQGVVKSGNGTMQYSGSTQNVYAGNTNVNSGILQFDKTNPPGGGGIFPLATSGSAILAGTTLTIGNGAGVPNAAVVRYATGAVGNQLGGTTVNSGVKVVINTDGLLDLNSTVAGGTITDRIGTGTGDALTMTGGAVSLGIGGTLDLDGTVHAVAAAAGNTPTSVITGTQVFGAIGGLDLDGVPETFNTDANTALVVSAVILDGANPTSLFKTGTGKLSFESNNTYSGATEIDAGTLFVDGSQPQSVVNIEAGGTLAGIGNVGTVTSTGGTIDPGDSPGIITITGNLNFDSASTYALEIDGTVAGTGYDRIAVSSVANLNNANLTVATNGTFAQGTSYTILTAAGGITTPGVAPAGTFQFNGVTLGQNATFTDSTGHTYQIHYNPNSVVLTLIANPPTVTTASGVTFTDVEGANSGVQTLATFVDPSGDPTPANFSATINWGDGTSVTTVGGAGITFNSTDAAGATHFTLAASHTYGEEGNYTITVTIHHVNAGDSNSVTDQATVTDANLVATGGSPIASNEGASTGTVTVATFTDPGGVEVLGDYSASINWGDGTAATAGTISVSGTIFTVQGSHTYTTDGPFTVTTTISHDSSTPQTVTTPVNVADLNVVAVGGFTFNAVEGALSTSQTVAQFTDPGGAEAINNYGATINWGDGTASTQGIITANGTTFTVSGQHTYAEEGNNVITVTITHDATSPQTVTSTAIVSDPNVVATGGQSIAAVEGTVSAVQPLATFTDPGGAEALTSYSATVNWGDGTATSNGVISVNGSTFTVSGQHTYGEEGTYTISVTINHDATAAQVVTSTATVSDPNVAAIGGFTFNAVEGAASTTQAVAQFTDPGGSEPNASDPTGTINSHYSASIDWGDSTAATQGIITLASGVFIVSGSHTYAEQSPAGGYTITVTIGHETTTAQVVTSTAVVSDPNVVATGGFSIAAVEGAASPSQTVAVFTDPGGPEAVGDYGAVVNWGDGTATSAGVISVSGNTFTVAGAHTYAEEGSFTITVTISHEGSQAQLVNSTATVSDPNVIATGGQTFTAVEGTAAASQTVATFTDPGGPEAVGFYAASINWGDNTTNSVGVITVNGNTFSVAGTHTYGEEGTYTITVTINHESTTQQIVTSTATVSDPNVVATGGFAFTAVEGTAPAVQTVATFTDPAGLEPNSFSPAGTLNNYYAASINWGDGATTNGTLSLNAGVVSVTGGHTYAEEGTFTITVTISHESSTAQVVTSTATVSDPAVIATGGFTITANEGATSTSQTVATFTDPGGPEVLGDYTATINWGDGTATSTGTITAAGNLFTVSGTHLYAAEGTYTVTTTIAHDAAPTATAISTANVIDLPVIVTSGSPITSVEGAATGTVTLATFTDPGGSLATSAYTANINWGDGTPATTGTVTQAAGVYTVTGAHSYGEEGSYTVTVSVTHGTAVAGTATVNATVSDPQVIWTSINAVTATEGRPISSTGTFLLGGFIDPAGQEPDASASTGNVSNYYGATVDWGDGSTPSTAIIGTGANNLITVSGNHVYAEPGKYTVTITASHEAAPTVQIKTTATVGDGNLVVTSLTAPNNVAAGAQFLGLVGTFTDANPSAKASDFQVGLYWGDNTMSLGSVLFLGNDSTGNAVFGVYAAKVYAKAGSYTMLMGVYDIDGAQVTTATPVNGVQVYAPSKQADLTAYNANLVYAYQQEQFYLNLYSQQHLGYEQFLANYWLGQFNFYAAAYTARASQP